MLTVSQILTILGLSFEFISVIITIRKLFYSYHNRLGKATLREEIRKDEIEGALTLIFLILGMVLQGLAVLNH